MIWAASLLCLFLVTPALAIGVVKSQATKQATADALHPRLLSTISARKARGDYEELAGKGHTL
jgi:hypothetical protein